MAALEVTEMSLKTIKAKVKNRDQTGITQFTDRDQCAESAIHSVKKTALESNCPLTRDEENFLIVARSHVTFMAINWMDRYFRLTGEYKR